MTVKFPPARRQSAAEIRLWHHHLPYPAENYTHKLIELEDVVIYHTDLPPPHHNRFTALFPGPPG